MRPSFAAAVALTVLVACKPAPSAAPPAAAAATGPAGLSAADEAGVRAVDSSWAAALNKGDAAALAAQYAPDAVLLPPDGPAVSGADNLRKAMDGFVGLKPTNVVLNTQHVEGRGDLAFATGTFEMTVGGQKATGHYGEVFTKQSDGSWKYRVDSYGFDAPAKK